MIYQRICFLLSSVLCSFLFPSSLYGSSDTPLAIPQGVLISAGLNASFVAKFALFVAVLLLWTIAFGKLFKALVHCPTIAGQIIGGILLGPSGINIAGAKMFTDPFTVLDNATGVFYSLASSDLFIFFILLISAALTVSYLMWIAGHETDVRDIVKVGVTAISAGILGALLPIGVVYLLAEFFFADVFTVS